MSALRFGAVCLRRIDEAATLVCLVQSIRIDDCRCLASPVPSAAIDDAFSTEISTSDDATVIRVTGEVAFATCRLLQEAVIPHVAPGHRIVLDFSDVTLLDSSGIGVILRAHQALAEVAGTLVVRNPTPATLRVLEVTGLRELLVERPEG